MNATRLYSLEGCLARLADSAPTRDLADADLLERFRAGGEEAAFALLVQRHGPAVLGVCRRLLGNSADADDAFQATFLVLLRKADSIRRRSSLGSWLHGVAFRVATKVRARRSPGTPLPDVPGCGGGPADEAARREVCAWLDEEITRLPERYRAPLVLCGLEGRTLEQAAREMGWPKSSLAHRLGRAKELLRARLARRGVALSAGVLAAGVAGGGRAAAVPALLTLATARLAKQAVAGGAPASAPAVVLAEGLTRGMASAWLAPLALAVMIGLAAAGAARVAGPPREPKPPPASPPAKVGAKTRMDREGFPLPAEAVARVGSARLRHGTWLGNLTYSPDGKVLASSGGGLLRLWDAGTGKLVRAITVANGDQIPPIPDGIFSADGKTILALDGATCRWFDVRTGKEVRHCDIKLPKTESHACFAPHGESVAVIGTGPGQDLVVYDLPSGKERFRKTARGSWFRALAFSPDGRTLAAMERGGKSPFRVKLFDVAAGRLLGEFDAGGTSHGLAFAPDGQKLLAHDFDKTVRVWSVPAGKPLHRVKARVVNPVMTAAFSSDGKSVIVGSQGLDVLRIDLATGKELRRFRTYPVSSSLALAPDGKTLAVGIGGSGVISQWDLATGKRLPASADSIAFGPPQFSGDGKLLWVPSETFAGIDWKSGREVRRVRVPHEGRTWLVALSPDRSRVAGLNSARKQAVWDASSGKELCVLSTAGSGEMRRAFSPDGKTLYTGEWEGPVRAWDVSTGKELPAFDRVKRVTWTLVVSPDGRRLASADPPRVQPGFRPEVTVWDLPGRREAYRLLPRPAGGRAFDLAFSPDGRLLAAVGHFPDRTPDDPRGFVMIWDLGTGKEWACRTVPTRLRSVAFSADGRLLATGGWDGSVRLWEVATGQDRYSFTGHVDSVSGVAFSPDGKLVAAASVDAPVFIWDVTGCYGRPPSTTPFSREEKASLWNALRDVDAAVAFQAMRRMMARPGPAVALLRGRLRPVPSVREDAVRRLLRDLDSGEFATREKAASDLNEIADRAEPLLRKALAKKPSAEAKRRIERALEAASPGAPARLREMRAVEVLERVGTAEARKLLDQLAGGAPGASLTREAKAAIGRMKKRLSSSGTSAGPARR